MIKEKLDSNKVFLLHEFLSSDECAALIRRSEGLACETGTVGGVVTDRIRNNQRVLVDAQALATRCFAVLRYGFRGGRPSPSGQIFQPHRDGSYLSLATYERSDVTFLVYLSGGMTGGGTRFFANMEHAARQAPYLTVNPTVGAALVFLHSVWHEGAVVHSGEKYVLRSDVMYKLSTTS